MCHSALTAGLAEGDGDSSFFPLSWLLSPTPSWRVWAGVKEGSGRCAWGTGSGQSPCRWWTAALSCLAESDGHRCAVKWHSSTFWIAWSTTTGAYSVICTAPGAIRSVSCQFLLDAGESQYCWRWRLGELFSCLSSSLTSWRPILASYSVIFLSAVVILCVCGLQK